MTDSEVVVGELVGWRTWFSPTRRRRDTNEYYLISAFAPKAWDFESTMTGDIDGYHGSIKLGVHSYNSLDPLRSIYYGRRWKPGVELLVYGEVWLWGRVAVHDRGYRAEYARPKSFYLGDDTRVLSEREEAYVQRKLRELRRNYGVEEGDDLYGPLVV